MILAMYGIVALTMNAVFFLLCGDMMVADPGRFAAVVASNLFLASSFWPLRAAARAERAPIILASQSFSGLCLLASFGWHIRLALLPSHLVLAVDLIGIGLFLALQMAMVMAARSVTLDVPGKHQDETSVALNQGLARAIDQALLTLSGPGARPVVSDLERLQRRARRNEMSADQLDRGDVREPLVDLSRLASARAPAAVIESAAARLLASLSEV
jgi:hypothetical protein